ncbi:MAG: hypothetical protein U0136_06990 [Bdellovibrionota bacterium]
MAQTPASTTVDASSDSMDDMKQTARAIGETVADAARQSAQSAKEKLSTVSEQVTDMGSDQIEKLESVIKSNPTAAVLVSAGIGFVIGMLLKRS